MERIEQNNISTIKVTEIYGDVHMFQDQNEITIDLVIEKQSIQALIDALKKFVE